VKVFLTEANYFPIVINRSNEDLSLSFEQAMELRDGLNDALTLAIKLGRLKDTDQQDNE